MTGVTIPTSKDIYIEVDGKKLAMVQACTVKSTRTSRAVEAFGSETPVATIGGKVNHVLELKKVVPAGNLAAGSVDFYSLSGFSVMIVKPDCRIVFSGCEWSGIGEAINLNAPCIETVQVVASKRMVL